ncbi:hypothetical protein [Neorhizobium galegae]|uniref:hypothetical protein n=1 Tax=Neorhizobium galegae TaxID=399 RepID=UPI001F26F48C|nr:hypothetical protein [Neorhizobium galegae]MCQ1574635.1 hypothetical protein [Neorhizobium galegae]UIK04793.1 hypothetical protein LZK81_19330 [Neorhizobium galegae]
MSEMLLVVSSSKARINAPAELIDLTGWLFNLSDSEYQACSKDHLAAASGFTREGKRLSINVETIGGDLLVQHYVEQISDRDHCQVRSVSDAFTHFGLTKMEVTWDLTVRSIGSDSCEFENRIEVRATPELLSALKEHGVPPEAARPRMQSLADEHNAIETPLFAKDIERKAQAHVLRRQGSVA